MKQFLKGKRFKTFAVTIGVVLLCLIIGLAVSSKASPVNAIFGTILTPVQKLAAAVSEKISDTVVFGSASAYEEKIRALEIEIAQYQKQLVGYDNTMYKLEAYEKMLEIKKKTNGVVMQSANIIGTDANDLFSTLILDKGSKDGISINDCVVSGDFAIGVVRSVKPTYCRVKTLLDPSVNVSVYETKSRETGYISTQAKYSTQGSYTLCGLNRDTKVKKNSLICTSGIGGVFPRDYIVGKVVKIEKSEADISCFGILKPGIDIGGLQDVVILTDFEGQGIEEYGE